MLRNKVFTGYYWEHEDSLWLVFKLVTFLMLIGGMLISCGTPKLQVTDEDYRIASAIPDDVARERIARYEGEEWVEKPYLIKKVVVHEYDKKRRFTNVQRNEEEQYISFDEMVIYPNLSNRCILVRISKMEGCVTPSSTRWLKDCSVEYTLFPYGVCPRTKVEMRELIHAFLALGARWEYHW
jgi:hypothetical protein